MKTIRKQLLIGSLGLTFLSVAITLVLILPISFSALEKQTHTHASRTSQLAAESVKVFWDEVVRSLNLLARVRGLSEFSDTESAPLVEALIRQNNAFEMVVLYDRKGKIIAQNSPYGRRALNSVSNQPFFRRSFLRHEEFLSNPQYDPFLKNQFVVVSLPIRNKMDRIDGVLMAHVNLHHISFLLSKIHSDLDGLSYLLDVRGNTIASSVELEKQYLADMQAIILSSSVQQQLRHSGHAQLEHYTGALNRPVLGNIRSLFGTPWLVVAEVPYSLVTSPVQNMLIFSLLGAFVALLFVWLVGRQIARKITLPLTALVDAAQKVSRGDYHADLKIDSHVEFSLLSTAFNEMASKVEKSIEDLQSLNDQLELRVEDRTRELSRTLEQLQKAQQELIESEKMAALGELVAGIAHEINTPVGICVTAASHISDDLNDLQKAFKEQTLTPSMLQEHIDQSHEALGLMRSNLNRASQLISDFKKVAVDQSHSEVREFLLVDYVRTVANSLTPRLKQKKHKVEVTGPEMLEVVHNPGAVSQIIVNLIMNSIIHGFDERREGLIKIEISQPSADQVVLEYSDNGSGMNDEQLAKVFHPFFTTRRSSGGSGLGGNIIYNLVTQVLKGSIRAQNVPEGGARFILRFPVMTPQQLSEESA
ncbi:sensor histidine kinase [Oceanospirillum beijerinckii]|uniref:sensor histidine kinase n=1 Tax=Oceanospirillum beijerinckii TaxID=64976 RepID=UPI0006888F7E|nr:ATP-binding protein [Oceanospirillum beijerinckii]